MYLLNIKTEFQKIYHIIIMSQIINLNKIILVLILIIGSTTIKAQQDPMYTQYMYNLSAVNPATIGRGNNMSFMMLDRLQWVGFGEGAPKTLSLTTDIPIKLYNMGVGLSYINDRIGPEQSNNIYIDYAYHINLTKNLKLGMGIKAGFKVYSAAFSEIGDDDDDQFRKDIYGDIMPNFGVGLFLYSNKYYFGFSSPKFVNHKYEGTNKISGGEERHYFIIGGYVWKINHDVVFKPSIYSKIIPGIPMSLDISANFLFKNKLWAGLAYRSGDAISILTQIQISQSWRFGYAYDISISKMSKVASGSHEIMLSYELRSFKDKVHSPRYF